MAIWFERDLHHAECVDLLRQLSPPLLTCWPVLTEAAWLLRQDPGAVQELFNSFDNGLLRLLELDQAAIAWIAGFLGRYCNLRAQVADAALVYLAERENIDTVFTLDRSDFSLYRRKGGRPLRILP